MPTKRADGYYVVWVDGKLEYLHRHVWELANGSIPKGMTIDHIDGDPSNNALDNLQMLSNSDNNRLGTATLKSSNTTGVNCVHLNQCGNWYGIFRLQGKRIYCGTYSSKEEAHQAVLAKRRDLNAPTRRMA